RGKVVGGLYILPTHINGAALRRPADSPAQVARSYILSLLWLCSAKTFGSNKRSPQSSRFDAKRRYLLRCPHESTRGTTTDPGSRDFPRRWYVYREWHVCRFHLSGRARSSEPPVRGRSLPDFGDARCPWGILP